VLTGLATGALWRAIGIVSWARQASQATTADLTLVGCVRNKRATACAAAELFASLLFEGRREYAVRSGLPSYTLSAKFGLLATGVCYGSVRHVPGQRSGRDDGRGFGQRLLGRVRRDRGSDELGVFTSTCSAIPGLLDSDREA
jgi:hypothetical protein